MEIDIDYAALQRTETPLRRVKLSDFVRAYATPAPGFRTWRHAWNPRNKRAVCGAEIKSTDTPRVSFTSDPDRNCVTCQRQWERWVGMEPTRNARDE